MPNAPQHILLIEDESAHAKLVSRAFQSTNGHFRLDVAASLDEARTLIDKSQPDLIIADFLLPDGKGTDLIPPNRETAPYPVIVLTSHGNEEVAVEAMKLGALDYVVKSDETLSELPRAAKRALREWSHILQLRKAEQERKRLEAILEATTDFVCMFKPDQTLLYMNNANRTFFGISKTQNLSEISCANHFPDWAYTIISKTGMPHAIEHGSWTGEIAMRSREGEDVPVSQVLLSHKDAHGNVAFLSSVARDLTEQKRADQEKRDQAVAQAKLSILSPRESQVLELVVAGKANKMIARELDLSEKTIEKHRASLMKKLKVRTVAELVRLAVAAHL